MESFESLYASARENRDAAIREARALYLRKAGYREAPENRGPSS